MHVLFPGSFDPPHLGHFDLVVRAAGLFERVTVGLGGNPEKKAFMPVERRLALLRSMVAGLGNVEVLAYEGQTAAFALKLGCQALLRGVRDGADLAYEHGMAAVNRDSGRIDTVFLLPAPAVSHISAALVRTALGAGLRVDNLLHPAVAAALAGR
jgi:pantetheine-phosphate adenylyltransferase